MTGRVADCPVLPREKIALLKAQGILQCSGKAPPLKIHDRSFEFNIAVSPDRLHSRARGKGRENGRLMAVFDGEMEWVGELPEEK
jgi:hypothetical protein